jgi:hypothetical protein
MAGGQGVAGSNPAVPTQVKGWFRVSAASFGCNGSARTLPSMAPAKRSGVPCRPGMLASGYWHSARPRAGSRPFPADSGELSSRSRGRRFRSGRPRLVLGTNSRRGTGRPSATTLSRLGPRRPATSIAPAFRCSLPPPTVSTPICQQVAIQPQLHRHRRWQSPPGGTRMPATSCRFRTWFSGRS